MRGRDEKRALLLAAVGLLALAAVVVPAPLPAQEPDLDSAARALARAWSSGRAGAMSGALAEDGVRVALLEKDYGTVDRRNAIAALESFLEQHEVSNVHLARASEVGGSPDRGFAEIRCDAVARGTSEVLTYTLFAGFARTDDAWRVVELRVLP